MLDQTDIASWTLADWQAWLIFKLESANTNNFRGCFFAKNLPKSHKLSLMWDIYMRHNWKNSLSKKSTNVKRSTRQFGSSSTQPEQFDFTFTGSANTIQSISLKQTSTVKFRVIWENVPDDVQNSAFGCFVNDVETLTEEKFRDVVAEKLGLKSYNSIIIEIVYGDEISFEDAVQSALISGERKNVTITTGDASETTLPELFEANLVCQFDSKTAMETMLFEFNELVLIDVSNTRLYRWRICQAVGLASNISPDIISARARDDNIELDPQEENLEVRPLSFCFLERETRSMNVNECQSMSGFFLFFKMIFSSLATATHTFRVSFIFVTFLFLSAFVILNQILFANFFFDHLRKLMRS